MSKVKEVVFLNELSDVERSKLSIATGYFLELDHGLMGFHPAVIPETGKMVVCTDKDLIKEVWETLSPRKSKLGSGQVLVSQDGKFAFDASKSDAERLNVVSREVFDQRMADKERPAFEWAPGVIGDDMSKDEFLKTIQHAHDKLSA
ncbi:hypothetical protein ISR92_00755 [Patescibacteria group bacterium]|nr:hypothetical protein [Patescibacteria group bacterium]